MKGERTIILNVKKILKYFTITIIFIIFIIILGALCFLNLLPQKSYAAEDFNIETIKSNNDYNENGIDDYTDIVTGARIDAKNKPKYHSAYYDGGYPPDEEGVCTDVIWRGFKNAGYSLKDMVDKDIEDNVALYPRVEGVPDKNIDFRRVPNLKVFFDRYAESLTLDPYDIEEWQPGDIVIYGEQYVHIAIISDKRNKDGVPYIIHNGGQPVREENMLVKYTLWQPITGHYRFAMQR